LIAVLIGLPVATFSLPVSAHLIMSKKRAERIEFCCNEALARHPDTGGSDLDKDRVFIYRDCMKQVGQWP
jgi:hypothetical protein